MGPPAACSRLRWLASSFGWTHCDSSDFDRLHDALRVGFSRAGGRIIADVDYDELVLSFRIVDEGYLSRFTCAVWFGSDVPSWTSRHSCGFPRRETCCTPYCPGLRAHGCCCSVKESASPGRTRQEH